MIYNSSYTLKKSFSHMVKVISSRTGVTVTLPALFHSAVPGNCPKTQETHKSKTFFQLRESKWEAATIVVNYTCAFPAMTSQNVRCNERSILTSCVFLFCRCLLFPAAPPSGRTDRHLLCSGLLDRAQTDSSVLMCNLLLFSSCLISVHTHTRPQCSS